jgi:hypothetical protein
MFLKLEVSLISPSPTARYPSSRCIIICCILVHTIYIMRMPNTDCDARWTLSLLHLGTIITCGSRSLAFSLNSSSRCLGPTSTFARLRSLLVVSCVMSGVSCKRVSPLSMIAGNHFGIGMSTVGLDGSRGGSEYKMDNAW